MTLLIKILILIMMIYEINSYYHENKTSYIFNITPYNYFEDNINKYDIFPIVFFIL